MIFSDNHGVSSLEISERPNEVQNAQSVNTTNVVIASSLAGLVTTGIEIAIYKYSFKLFGYMFFF